VSLSAHKANRSDSGTLLYEYNSEPVFGWQLNGSGGLRVVTPPLMVSRLQGWACPSRPTVGVTAFRPQDVRVRIPWRVREKKKKGTHKEK
jgi:hypothetical protein